LVLKDEEDYDVSPYVHTKNIENVIINTNDCLDKILLNLNKILFIPFKWLLNKKVVPIKILGMFKRSKEINKGIAYNIMLHVKENNAKFVEELGYGKKK
jgi:ERCC4-related helicase